jgi:hypothetical protein
MQPLDVSVFAPMKKWWRQILSAWKEDCARINKNFATLPKQEFPALLKQLMEKDYQKAIVSGFESCGLFPLNPERALAKLPKEDREVESSVQLQLLNRLSLMRYNQPETTHASRPKKKDKLPAGASYTCLPGQKALVGLPVDNQKEMEEMALALEEGRSPVFTPESSEGEEMTRETDAIIHRLGRKSKKAKIWRVEDDQESVTSTTTSDSDSEDSAPKKRKTNSVRKNWLDELNGSWDSEEDKAGVIYRTKNIFFPLTPLQIGMKFVFPPFSFTFSSFSLHPFHILPPKSHRPIFYLPWTQGQGERQGRGGSGCGQPPGCVSVPVPNWVICCSCIPGRVVRGPGSGQDQ